MMERTTTILIPDLKTDVLVSYTDSIAEAINKHLESVGVGDNLHNLGYSMHSSVFYLLLSETAIGETRESYASTITYELMSFLATILDDLKFHNTIPTEVLDGLKETLIRLALEVHQYVVDVQCIMRTSIVNVIGGEAYNIVDISETPNGIAVEVSIDG